MSKLMWEKEYAYTLSPPFKDRHGCISALLKVFLGCGAIGQYLVHLDVPENVINKCTCSITDIMAHGCKCGHLRK